MALRIDITGITLEEARQIEDLLKDMEGVEDVTVSTTEDIPAGVIRASADHASILVQLAVEAGKAIIKEVTTDVYKSAKSYIQDRLEEWKASRTEPRRKRIEFEFSEDDELRNTYIN